MKKLNFRGFSIKISYCAVALLFVLVSLLFGLQAIQFRGGYASDYGEHLKFALSGEGYSLLYVIIGVLYRILDSSVLVILLEGSMIILTLLITKDHLENQYAHNSIVSFWIAFCLLFLCSPYVPGLFPWFYKNGLITQPWHNITYIGMRPFALLAYFATGKILKNYQEEFSWKNWLAIAIPLFISTNIKPNYLITYCFTLLIILAVDFLKDAIARKLTFLRFARYIFLGTVVFPSLFILFMQSKVLYGVPQEAVEESGIAVTFLTSSFFAGGFVHTTVKVIRDLLFPTIVWIYARGNLSKAEKMAYLQYLITLIVVICLKETGPRANHGNFYWGIFMSAYILFLSSLSKFAEFITQNKWSMKNNREKVFACVGCILAAWHVISGLVYFGKICFGCYYLI